MVFDQSHTRLITAEADKTIKMYKEDEEAVSFVIIIHLFWNFVNFNVFSSSLQTEESHPIVWRPEILKKKQY
jgi:pleiotropic regulator 1